MDATRHLERIAEAVENDPDATEAPCIDAMVALFSVVIEGDAGQINQEMAECRRQFKRYVIRVAEEAANDIEALAELERSIERSAV